MINKIYVITSSGTNSLYKNKTIGYSEEKNIAERFKSQLEELYPKNKFNIEERNESIVDLYTCYSGLNIIEYNGNLYPNNMLRREFSKLNEQLSFSMDIIAYLKEMSLSANESDKESLNHVAELVKSHHNQMKNEKLKINFDFNWR